MLDDVKILIDAVGKMDGGPIYILLAFLAYKVIVYCGTTGAIVFIGKLFIEKCHDVMITKKTVKTEATLELSGHIITKTDNVLLFKECIGMVLNRPSAATGQFLHNSDLHWLRDAIQEKRHADDENRNAA